MIKLFTHEDLDGIGCAILAKLAFGENVDISYCDYDNINIKVRDFIVNENRPDMCHITDISIEDELAEIIDSSFDNFKILDHHPTALFLNKYDWCCVQTEDLETGIKTSGTELYYRWLINHSYLQKNDILDVFVETIRNYDTWQWTKLGEGGLICKQINDLLYLYGRDRFIDWCISEIDERIFPKLFEVDKLVLDIKQKEIDNYIEEKDKQLITSPLCGRVCGFVFAEKYFSELGNKLCKMHPEIDFIAMIDMDGTVSYRTIREDIDLGKDVARLFGGGGHPKAAGSQFSKAIPLKVIQEIYQ